MTILVQPPHVIARKREVQRGETTGWPPPGHVPSPELPALARRRRDWLEKLLPSFSESSRVGVAKLTSQLARDELPKWALSQDASWEHGNQD